MMCPGSAGKEASAELSGGVRFQADVCLPPTPWCKGVQAADWRDMAVDVPWWGWFAVMRKEIWPEC